MALKRSYDTVSTWYIVDSAGNIMQESFWGGMTDAVRITKNDNVEPYRAGRHQPNLFTIN